MARPRQPIDLIQAKGKKHLTKAEIEKRKKEELKVDLKNVQAPDFLPDNLKEGFNEIAKKLLSVGIMTELDEDCLTRYLLARQSYLQYTNMLNRAIRKNDIAEMEKLATMQDKAFKQCRASGNDLGLSITSRCKLIMPDVNKEEPKVNKFSKFGV